MRVSELRGRLWAKFPELVRERTVDQIICGPDQEITGVAVCWMPYLATLREAAALGANLVVAHEPTFFDHYELREQPADPRLALAKADKLREIEALGLTVLRCHDVWDAVAGEGVADQWSRFLGLNDVVEQDRYMRVHRVDPAPAREVARRIAQRTAPRGQATVGLYGDPDRVVSRVGVGTGCYSNPARFQELGAEMAVAVDDIVRAWIDGEWAMDTGYPILVVNHGVSEDCAMHTLAEAVRRELGSVPVRLIRQGCSYLEVTA